MDQETAQFVLSISGVLLLLMLSAIGFFVSRLISDVKRASIEVGKNRAKFELVQQQQINDVKRIEERTQLELANLTKNVCLLSDNVNTLVLSLAKKNVSKIISQSIYSRVSSIFSFSISKKLFCSFI